MSSATIVRRGGLALGIILSAASQAQAKTRYIHTTSTKCYNEQGQRIKCPFHWTPAYIVLTSIGGFIGLCGILWLMFTCCRRSKRNKEISVTEEEISTSRWRWPWSKKYQKVSDPERESTLPNFRPSQEQLHEPVPVVLEPAPDDVSEKLNRPRQDEDDYYVPPELKYSYKPTTSASTSVVSLPKPELPQVPVHEPPPYPPPLPL